jgi:hypothetical protein
VKSKTNLFQVVAAGVATCRLTCLLDRWQEQADKHADDGDDDQEFNQRKSSSHSIRSHCFTRFEQKSIVIVDQLVRSTPRPTILNNRLFVGFYKKKSQFRQFVVRRRFFFEETGSLPPPDMAK